LTHIGHSKPMAARDRSRARSSDCVEGRTLRGAL